MSPLAKMWSLLLLLPLVPVVLLYLLFEKQNYFELQETAKGILAAGPIAAYVGLVLVAWKIYLRISPMFVAVNAQLDQICGDWLFESTSRSGNTRVGDCYIRNERGQLVINGNFKNGDKTVGTWECELAGLRGNNLLMVYTLREIKEGKSDNLYGLVQVPFGEATASEMTGIWTVIGRADLDGTIKYTRRGKVGAGGNAAAGNGK
ncbi:MAG TPA: hypothetical protein VJT74_13020 [Pyrinomonadaceae bacterium]|nr:hypothetical protein [Pyrinomonadaceae bacterium]